MNEHINEHIMDDMMKGLSKKFKPPHYEKVDSLPIGVYFYYHTSLKLLICGGCECGIVFDHIISHCRGKHNIPQNKLSSQSLEQEITLKNWDPIRTEESAKHLLSTLNNCDPIVPFPVVDGFECSVCRKCYCSKSTFKNNHLNAGHIGEKLNVKVQTLFAASNLKKYYKVNASGKILKNNYSYYSSCYCTKSYRLDTIYDRS
ncbi:MAG: hypothetical protein IM592_14370 [Bacteroidetes bacterium]|nr:hypothetical protein [Bacteroidota bacterium]